MAPMPRSFALVVALLAFAPFGCGQENTPAKSPDAPNVATPNVPPSSDAPAPAPAAAAKYDPNVWPYAPGRSAEEKAAQLAQLEKDPGPIRTNWVPPGKTERYGHAEGLIAAPYDAVRARLVDFAHYKDLAGKRFKKVSLVDKVGDGSDIYFLLPIMKGLITIWYVTRFMPPRPGKDGSEVIEGTFVKGNVKDVHFVFTVRPAKDDKQSTVLVCDLLLGLSIPAPQPNVDEALRDACGDAIRHTRDLTMPPPPPPAP